MIAFSVHVPTHVRGCRENLYIVDIDGAMVPLGLLASSLAYMQ